jgi:DNA-binding NarL/FixJ family response regulator
MRVVIVGPDGERARLRREADAVGIEIAGEFETVSAARTAGIPFDAALVATKNTDATPLEEPLTARELQVLALLADGLSNKTIAAQLRISDQTVKAHVAATCGKLGAANRTDAVRRAIRRGLVTI